MSRGVQCLLLTAVAVLSPLWPAPIAGDQIRDVSIPVGDRTVHALCTAGPRSVVLLHGEGGSAESWRPVLRRLSGTVGACAYDRGESRQLSEGRGWFELMYELQSVHAALGVEPRYILVGHAIAGLYARLYAVDRPLDLGGLVLIEPAHEDLPDAVVLGMPDAALTKWAARRSSPNGDGVRETDLARHARGSRLPDIPVAVITAMTRKDGNGWDARFLSQAARRVHASILRGVRSARHIPAAGSGQEVHLEAPDLVAREISRMVRMTFPEA